MLFSKKPLDLKTLKETDPETYEILKEQIKQDMNSSESEELKKANALIMELTQKTEKEAKNSKILTYGSRLKVSNIAEEAIKSDLSFDEALVKMVDSHLENLKDMADSFQDTASAAAGSNLDDDANSDSAPKTFTEAMMFISKRDNITKAEAAKLAQIEYPDLFNTQYE